MKNNKIIIIAVVLAIVAALGITVAAAYDSSEDPIVSLSYLIEVFKPDVLDEFEGRFETLEEYLIDTVNDYLDNLDISGGDTNPDETPDDNPTQSAVPYGYEVIELTTGDALYAVSACDIMLRAGEASCIAPDASQGIADYTSAAEIYDGQSLTLNHMCLIPRGDGRGVLAESVSVFLMVRGEYTIVKK